MEFTRSESCDQTAVILAPRVVASLPMHPGLSRHISGRPAKPAGQRSYGIRTRPSFPTGATSNRIYCPAGCPNGMESGSRRGA